MVTAFVATILTAIRSSFRIMGYMISRHVVLSSSTYLATITKKRAITPTNESAQARARTNLIRARDKSCRAQWSDDQFASYSPSSETHSCFSRFELDSVTHITIGCEPSLDKSGGLNGSMQHFLKVFLQESMRLISFAGVNSNEAKPCLSSD
jgi:hypothetical protein